MEKLKLIRAPHKYLQGAYAMESFYEETKDLGNSFLFIASNSGYKYCKDSIEKSFEGSNATRRYEIFGGISSVSEIEKMQKIVEDENIDVVVALGGGSAIDTAKATAYYAGRPVVILPTIVATDAPCTGLSVIYNDDGSFNQYIFYPKSPDAVIVDSNVIVNAPVKYIVAGMGDALATYFEWRAASRTGSLTLEQGGISNTAGALCTLCFETLLEYGVQAKLGVERKVVTPAVDKIIEAATYLSGVGADNGGLAAAHSIYNGVSGIDGNEAMHGDVVAYGTISQLILEGASQEEIDEIIEFCYSVGLPITLKEIGIKNEEDLMVAAKKACAEGESIHNLPNEMTPKKVFDAMLLADSLGQDFHSLF